jgi:Ca-activated chloride channel family protein
MFRICPWCGFSFTLAILLASLGGNAKAGDEQAENCRLALVLALDVSASVDEKEYRLQTEGLAQALRDGEVREAIVAIGGVWFSSFEWSGRHQHTLQVDWVHLDGDAAIEATAARLSAVQRGYTEFPTAIGYALGYASVRLKELPYSCDRKVVDVSGDGVNNEGFGPDKAYNAFDFNRVTVNGLVVESDDQTTVSYYQREIIRGPGAFVEVARDYNDYRHAMKRKLLREIRGDAFASLR